MILMKKIYLPLLFAFLIPFLLPAKGTSPVTRIDPPHWWAAMPVFELELMIYGPEIQQYGVEVDYADVTVAEVRRPENRNYLFITLKMGSDVRAGKMKLVFSKPGVKKNEKPFVFEYELKEREGDPDKFTKVDASDFIYLLMPDRFSNGDPKNDIVEGMRQTSLNRKEMFDRHGGDLRGIINHLDYLKELGVTTLWLNPVQENDMPDNSYHGYAFTDHYRIDPRLGTLADYKELEQECRKRNMKLVMDVVYNHTGIEHYFLRDLPEKTWLNHVKEGEFVQTSYRAPTLLDPHVSSADRLKMSDGWFTKAMPDLNQRNASLARYLLQNNLWWIEETGIDAFRIDTYAYSDQQFMADIVKQVQSAYPGFAIFGETWVHGPGIQTYFQQNTVTAHKIQSNMPGVTDFQLYYAINEALTHDFGWTDGVARLYYMLAQDYLVKDPMSNVVFLDNHDLSRFYSVVGEDYNKYKMGIGWLLTTRGIPQLYYGTEILMKNFADPDGKVRDDFPGGWQGDVANKFSATGRAPQEEAAHAYVKKIANWRQNHPDIFLGEYRHFVPENGIYVYFRIGKTGRIMVVMNQNDSAKSLEMSRFEEFTKGYSSLMDIETDQPVEMKQQLEVPAKTTWILELK